jgi:hypothetical protein
MFWGWRADCPDCEARGRENSREGARLARERRLERVATRSGIAPVDPGVRLCAETSDHSLPPSEADARRQERVDGLEQRRPVPYNEFPDGF